jgi:hypothetical protein
MNYIQPIKHIGEEDSDEGYYTTEEINNKLEQRIIELEKDNKDLKLIITELFKRIEDLEFIYVKSKIQRKEINKRYYEKHQKKILK